jgi:hypothetical protein
MHYMLVTERRLGKDVVLQILGTFVILALLCGVAGTAAFLLAGQLDDLWSVLLGGVVYLVVLAVGAVAFRDHLLKTSGNRT